MIDEFEATFGKMPFAVPDSYGRQYVGTHGHVLTVYFFCDPDIFPYHAQLDAVADGFPCRRLATYDLRTKTITPRWYVPVEDLKGAKEQGASPSQRPDP